MLWSRRKKEAKVIPRSLAPSTSESTTAPGSKNLWAQAYAHLSDEKPELVRKFLTLLYAEVETSPNSTTSASTTATQAPPTQDLLAGLIAQKVALMKDRRWKLKMGNKSIELREQVDRILQILVVVKDFGSSLASMDPIHAGLPWAAVSMLVPLLLRESQQQTVLTDGLENIAKLLRRFGEIETFYIRKTQHRLCKDLEEALTELYCHVLEFEARAICQYDRNTASQATRNIVKADGWQDILDAISQSETACNILTRIIDTETQHSWNEHIESIITEQARKVDEILRLSERKLTSFKDVSDKAAEAIDGGTEVSDEAFDAAKCLASLRTTDYETDKNKNPLRLAGTCEWVLKHGVYQNWLENRGIGWLWLTANPGCGKSVLARTLIDELGAAEESQVCYFFFKDDSEKRRNVNHAVCAILHQIMSADKSLLRHARSAFFSNGNKLPDLMEPLWQVFLSAIEGLARPIICVLDALDECLELGRMDLFQKLASLFQNRSRPSMLKVVMLSRPNTPIGDTIWNLGVDPASIQLSGERTIESRAITKEIDLYIAAKIQNLESLRRRRGISDDACSKLSAKLETIENRTYLWVSLIFPELESQAGVSSQKMLRVIDEVPVSVHAAYERILNRSLDSKRARTMLHLIVVAFRPLTLEEMNAALAVQTHSPASEDLDLEPSESFAGTVRELCGLFITIEKSRIYLIHQTAKEFLLCSPVLGRTVPGESLSWAWRHSFEPIEGHKVAAQTCMLTLYFPNLYMQMHKQQLTRTRIWDLKKGSWGALLDYACEHWALHFSCAKLLNVAANRQQIAEMETSQPSQTNFTWASLYGLVPLWCPLSVKERIGPKINPLIVASYYGHITMVEIFLHSYNVTDKGVNSLRWALQKHHTEIAHLLLDNVPNVPESSEALNATLHIACNEGEQEIVSRLIASPLVDHLYSDVLGRTALLWTTVGGHVNLFTVLLNLREQFRVDIIACFLVAASLGHVEIIGLLLSYAPDQTTPYHYKALWYAVAADHGPVVQRIIMQGGNFTVSDAEFDNLVLHAYSLDKKASIDILLQYPITLDACDSDGQSLLYITRDVAERKVLVESGANVNLIPQKGWSRRYDGWGESILYQAVASEDLDFTRLLLEKGAQVNVRCERGATALHRAASIPNSELVRILIEAGADPSIQDENGLTAIDRYQKLSSDELGTKGISIEDRQKLLDLLQQKIMKASESQTSIKPVRRLRHLIPNPKVYLDRLCEHEESIDLEMFDQILEMDDVTDEGPIAEFSRALCAELLPRGSRYYVEDARLSLMTGDFSALRGNIGEGLKGSCATIGLRKAEAICEPFSYGCLNIDTWTGSRPDGEDPSEDFEVALLLKEKLDELEAELAKVTEIMQDFYYDIEDPRFDPDPEEFERQKKILSEDN